MGIFFFFFGLASMAGWGKDKSEGSKQAGGAGRFIKWIFVLCRVS